MGMPPRKLNTAICDKISEQPGIAQDALMQFAFNNVDGVTEKQIKKTISNLLHSSKKIRSEGLRGKFTYHPNNEAHQPTIPASSTVKKQEVKAVQLPDEKDFSLMLTDDNNLHLIAGDLRMVLKPAQTSRLKTFMDRITFAGEFV